MTKIKIDKKALLSFIIFIIAISKDFLVTFLKIIPERSPLNRQISFYFILPCLLLGLIFSLLFFYEMYKKKSKWVLFFIDINSLLAWPTMLCFIYGLIMIIFSFT